MYFLKSTVCLVIMSVGMLLLPLQVQADEKVSVYTVNYPLFYFAQRIGGEHVDVVFPAPDNVDPAFWTPDTATIRKFQQADLIILNGAGYAKWTRKTSLPLLRTIDTSRSFKNDLIKTTSAVTHSHGPSGDHSHGGTAFTTWLDFSMAAQQAEAIYQALLRKRPSSREDFTKNLGALKKDLLQLDDQVLDLSRKKPNLPLIASHPIYQYMAKRYALNLKMVMWEPDVYPEKEDWNHFGEMVKDQDIKWMVWEGQPLTESENRLQDMGIKSVVFSPCFAKPQQGDFLSVMQQNVHNFMMVFN